ncbi:hypothetical protein D3C76_1545830 [compost metagenome]
MGNALVTAAAGQVAQYGHFPVRQAFQLHRLIACATSEHTAQRLAGEIAAAAQHAGNGREQFTHRLVLANETRCSRLQA